MHTVDILLYIHPDISDEQRISFEESLSECNGVMHVRFKPKLGHEINITYDPDAISADAMRRKIRDWDKDAKVVGLQRIQCTPFPWRCRQAAQ